VIRMYFAYSVLQRVAAGCSVCVYLFRDGVLRRNVYIDIHICIRFVHIYMYTYMHIYIYKYM